MPTLSTLGRNRRYVREIKHTNVPVIFLHKGIGGDRGKADADEKVDEEVGNEGKVEGCSQDDGQKEIPSGEHNSH